MGRYIFKFLILAAFCARLLIWIIPCTFNILKSDVFIECFMMLMTSQDLNVHIPTFVCFFGVRYWAWYLFLCFFIIAWDIPDWTSKMSFLFFCFFYCYLQLFIMSTNVYCVNMHYFLLSLIIKAVTKCTEINVCDDFLKFWFMYSALPWSIDKLQNR